MHVNQIITQQMRQKPEPRDRYTMLYISHALLNLLQKEVNVDKHATSDIYSGRLPSIRNQITLDVEAPALWKLQ